MSTEIEKKENQTTVGIDLMNSELPILDDLQVVPISLGGEYWTPMNIGEKKRVFFYEVKSTKLVSFNGGEIVDLDCAYFLEQDKDLNTKTIYNGSRVLVGIIEANIESGLIKKGVPLEITYDGKKKNKSNGNLSDRWTVKPLILNI